MFTRRQLLEAAAVAGAGAVTFGADAAAAPKGFVTVRDGHFMLDGKPYRFAGTNVWYAAYLGMTADGQARLKQELDTLLALGVTNLRILGAAEISPLKNSMRPAIQDGAGHYDETILAGLDFALAEIGRRGMKAVVFLNNFWEWSGGMVTYQYWTNGGHYIDLGDPNHPWPEFADYSAQFYKSAAANARYRAYIAALIRRRNTVTGRIYRDDPAIMAWQLANEPRPGGSVEKTDMKAFFAWTDSTAGYIKSLDTHHLVSTGNEGVMGCLESEGCVTGSTGSRYVDYLTFHIWPLNWGWINPADMEKSFAPGTEKVRRYVETHLRLAANLKKPAVCEEFGFPRDGGSNDPKAGTVWRDRYYTMLYGLFEENAQGNGAFGGSNFWAWGGAGRAQHADYNWQPGDTSYVGDPAQEPQGRNSVFDRDMATIDIIRRHAAALAAL